MLEERMVAVAREHGFPFEARRDGETYLVECAFEGGRTQVVSGTTVAAEGRRTHVVFTIVGPYAADVELEDLVERQMTWRRAKIGILGDDLVVCSCLDPERVRGDEGGALVDEALREVSTLGDALEEELFGRDEN